jgi:hypothetical protein
MGGDERKTAGFTDCSGCMSGMGAAHAGDEDEEKEPCVSLLGACLVPPLSFHLLFPDAPTFGVFGRRQSPELFYFFDEFPPGEKTVDRLAPVFHAFDFKTGRPVQKIDARRRLVYVLAAFAR